MDETQDTSTEPQAPYVIEGARSSRSRCKTCRRKIDKGSLRIGMLIEGPYGTGYLWHHLKCAAKRQLDRVEEAYGLEAWKEAKEPPKKVPDLEELRKHAETAQDRKRVRKPLPRVELAPTGRSKCKRCGDPIEKDQLRVALGRAVHFGSQVRVSPVNVHPRCVVAELDSPDCAIEVEGFAQALRENSPELGAERLDAVLSEIGTLPEGPATGDA